LQRQRATTSKLNVNHIFSHDKTVVLKFARNQQRVLVEFQQVGDVKLTPQRGQIDITYRRHHTSVKLQIQRSGQYTLDVFAVNEKRALLRTQRYVIWQYGANDELGRVI